MKKYLLVVAGIIIGIIGTSYAAYKLKAEQVSFDKSNTDLNSNDVQSAIDELADMKSKVIGTEVNINNNNSYKTGYSALPSTNQQTYPGTYGDGESYNQPYNTEIGYLASTTGNITGVYDMSGGANEYVAGYISGNTGSSGLTVSNYDSKYFDIYPSNSTYTSYQNRILGDATGEMGPFKQYSDGDGGNRYHNSWYAEISHFGDSYNPWFRRGGDPGLGVLAGQFYFYGLTGAVNSSIGFRLVLSIK